MRYHKPYFAAVWFLFVLNSIQTVWGQTSYNRWEASPLPSSKAVTSSTKPDTKGKREEAEAGKERQDSLRITSSAIRIPLLKRGIGERIKNKNLLPEDSVYKKFIINTIRYPQEALQAQTDGKIIIRLTVDASGQVVNLDTRSPIPIGTPGREAMIREARLLVRQLRFKPSDKSSEEELEIEFIMQ
jgi:TonB family protein